MSIETPDIADSLNEHRIAIASHARLVSQLNRNMLQKHFARLLELIPSATSLSWVLSQEYDDTGYYQDITDIELHLWVEPDGNHTVCFGKIGDIENQEWEYIDALTDDCSDEEQTPSEISQRIIASFAVKCHAPHIQSEEQVKFILLLISEIIYVALSDTRDAESIEIKLLPTVKAA